MSDNRADVAKAAAELHRSVRGAAVRWNNRETRRWSEGEDDLEAGSLEFSVRAKSLGGIIDSAAFVRVFAPGGRCTLMSGFSSTLRVNSTRQTRSWPSLAESLPRHCSSAIFGAQSLLSAW